MAERLSLEVAGQGELLLAIESATRRASVVLQRGSNVVGELEAPSSDQHAERLLPMIDDLLVGADTTLAEIRAFAISIGPGAFTSLRIGLATLKGLAFGTPVEVAAVSTLHAIADTALDLGRVEPGEICVPLLDARRGAFYAGAYRVVADAGDGGHGRLEPVFDDLVCDPEELGARLEGRVALVGEGAALFGDAIVAVAKQRANTRIDAGEAMWPTARSVARIGAVALAAGEGVPAGSLVPRYLRRTQAEEQRAASTAN